MKRLLTRSLVMVSGALAVFIGVLSLSLVLGTSQVLRSWEARENRGLSVFLETRLRALAEQLSAENRPASSAEVAAAVEGFPYNPDWIIVQSADDALLYFYRPEERQIGQGRNLLRRLQDIESWSEIRLLDGSLVFKYSSLVPSFSQSESNRLLLAALALILGFGSLAAGLIAVVVAYRLARPVARHAERLAASLEAIGAGRRDVELNGESVSELERIAQAAGRLQFNLFNEEELRRRWAADVAHDLRTPLTVLKGQLEALVDGVFPASPERLDKSYREVLRLEALVNDLSLLTRLETPGFRAGLRELRSRAILEEVARRFADLAAAQGSAITIEGLDLTLLADPTLLDRALANVVDNALRYGEAGGPIVLRSAASADDKTASAADRSGVASGHVILSVLNRGLIAAEHRPRLFDRLYRGDEGRRSAGSGLGLAIAKAAADAQKAALTVACDETAGTTTFAFTFAALAVTPTVAPKG